MDISVLSWKVNNIVHFFYYIESQRQYVNENHPLTHSTLATFFFPTNLFYTMVYNGRGPNTALCGTPSSVIWALNYLNSNHNNMICSDCTQNHQNQWKATYFTKPRDYQYHKLQRDLQGVQHNVFYQVS